MAVRSVVAHLVLFCGSLFVAFGILELSLRAIYPSPIRFLYPRSSTTSTRRWDMCCGPDRRRLLTITRCGSTPWVFAIAARVRLDELRRRLRLPEDAGEDAIARADEQLPRDPPAGNDLRDAVRSALDGLPESQRTVIHLHRYEGMTFAEIARALDTTEGAVKLRAFRGYERLREQLKELL